MIVNLGNRAPESGAQRIFQQYHIRERNHFMFSRSRTILRPIIRILAFASLVAIVPREEGNAAPMKEISDSAKTTILVRSSPDSVEVYADSIFQGNTPYRVEVSGGGKTVLRFQKTGYVSQSDTLAASSQSDSSVFVRLYKVSGVTISSSPESASVLVANEPMGITPLVLSGLGSEPVQISVYKIGYQPWFSTITPHEGDELRLTARLKRIESSLSIFVESPAVSVFLNDKLVSKGSLFDFETAAGTYKLNIEDQLTGRRSEIITTVKDGYQHFYRGSLGVPSVGRALLTTVLPGSAQFADGAYMEAGLVFAGSVLFGYGLLRAQSEYNNRLDQYDQAVDSYRRAATEEDASRQHTIVQSRRADLDTYERNRTIYMSLFAGCYIYGLVDALVNHLITDRITIVPNYELLPAEGSPIQQTSQGAQIRVRF